MNMHPIAPHWMFLSKAPFYTPVVLPAPECREPLIAMRVEELGWFSHPCYQTIIRFTAWCGPYDTWVVAFPFRLEVHHECWVEGTPCLNPRNFTDAALLDRFAHQELIYLWLL